MENGQLFFSLTLLCSYPSEESEVSKLVLKQIRGMYFYPRMEVSYWEHFKKLKCFKNQSC